MILICSLYFASWLCLKTPPVIPPKLYECVEARITCYAPTGYNMANTKPPKNGWVAVSDRTIPFDTKIEVRGKEYKVGDRTAKWVHEKHVLTIDIFMESGCDMTFGAKRELVKIYR